MGWSRWWGWWGWWSRIAFLAAPAHGSLHRSVVPSVFCLFSFFGAGGSVGFEAYSLRSLADTLDRHSEFYLEGQGDLPSIVDRGYCGAYIV